VKVRYDFSTHALRAVRALNEEYELSALSVDGEAMPPESEIQPGADHRRINEVRDYDAREPQ